jgi:CheY-like chemotaxis protein
MKILIIDDDPAIRRMLRAWIIALAGQETIVHEAGSLQEAEAIIGESDGVLCDGAFPTSWDAAGDGALGGPQQNWPHVAGLADKRGVPFVLLTGDSLIVAQARACHRLVFEKPAKVRAAVQALIAAVTAGHEPRQKPGDNPAVEEMVLKKRPPGSA